MKGNFSRFFKNVDKLDNISTSNIRNIIQREEQLLTTTKEDDFNQRFKMEMAGDGAIDSEEEELDQHIAKIAN